MVDLILGILVVGMAFLFLFMREGPPHEPVAYWKIVLTALVVSFAWAMFRHGFSLAESLGPWASQAAGLSVGFCVAEAARRYRDRRRAA